jgi:hypothetical protein
LNFSTKKVINTISGVLFGAAVGNSLNNLGNWNYVILAVFIIPFFMTLDWSESLEEKKVKGAHNKEDLKILKQELKKKEIQDQLDALNGKKP